MELSNRYFGPVWDGLIYSLVTGEGRALRDVHFTIENGRGSIIRNQFRRLNYRYMVAEWLWNWFGRDDLQILSLYDTNAGERSTDGVTVSSWGKSTRANWASVHKSLVSGQQGFLNFAPVAAVTDPRTFPRIASIQFVESTMGSLGAVVTMLRNDAWKTLPYDVHHMCQLVNIMSSELGMNIGAISFNVGELVMSPDHMGMAIASIDSETLTHFANRVTTPPAAMEHVLANAPHWTEKEIREAYPMESPWDLYSEALACTSPLTCYNLLGLKC